MVILIEAKKGEEVNGKENPKYRGENSHFLAFSHPDCFLPYMYIQVYTKTRPGDLVMPDPIG